MNRKTALITGATSGIGMACARRFAVGGYNLIITGRSADKLQALKAELEAGGVEVLALAFDVCNREATRDAVASIPDAFKPIDVLINNAGLARGLEPEYEGDFQDWDEMIDIYSNCCYFHILSPLSSVFSVINTLQNVFLHFPQYVTVS